MEMTIEGEQRNMQKFSLSHTSTSYLGLDENDFNIIPDRFFVCICVFWVEVQ